MREEAKGRRERLQFSVGWRERNGEVSKTQSFRMRPGEEETNFRFPNIPFHTCSLNSLIPKGLVAVRCGAVRFCAVLFCFFFLSHKTLLMLNLGLYYNDYSN